MLLLAAFWDTNTFTAEIVYTFTLDSFRQIVEQPVYRDVAQRTITMAALVTVADAVLLSIAYYMAGWRRRGCATSSSWRCSCLCGRATS